MALTDREAAELVSKNATDRLQWLCLAHLSAQNNTAEKALETNRKILGDKLPIQVTSRYRATEIMILGPSKYTGLLPTHSQLFLDI